MSLSRRDYEAIAKILNECLSKDEIVSRLGLYFYQDNPNFDMLKFLKAVYHGSKTTAS